MLRADLSHLVWGGFGEARRGGTNPAPVRGAGKGSLSASYTTCRGAKLMVVGECL